MIVDARELPDGADLRGDVCVVGGGPLAIAVAQRLADAGLDVAMVESGGSDKDPAADDLGEPGRIEFGNVTSLGNTRRLGGNAHAWQVRTGASWRGVRLVPLAPVDIEGREGYPGSAWPIGYDELDTYLSRAQEVFGLPAVGYDPAPWADGVPETPLDDPDVQTSVFQFSDGGVFVDRGVAVLAESPRVTVYHHATAVEVLTDASASRAVGVRVVSASGRDLEVRANHVVLAAGCIGSTQLLLASDAVRPAGLGNEHDQLGRNFMDHLLLDAGRVRPESPADFARRAFYDLRVVDGVPVMGHLHLSAEALRRDGLLNLSMMLFPRERGYERRQAMSRRQRRGLAGALAVRESLLRREPPRVRSVRDLVLGVDGVVKRAVDGRLHPVSSVGRGGWSQPSRRPRRFEVFDVVQQAEQAPHPDNRITLSQERDAAGLRKVDVAWRWHDEDVEATMRAQDVFARGLRRSGWGEFEMARQEGRPVVRSYSSNHFMGTTRMSELPQDGVVDPFGAVHGVPNLFVASSSVFPSGGYGNVTLTALALALRSADRVVAQAGR